LDEVKEAWQLVERSLANRSDAAQIWPPLFFIIIFYQFGVTLAQERVFSTGRVMSLDDSR